MNRFAAAYYLQSLTTHASTFWLELQKQTQGAPFSYEDFRFFLLSKGYSISRASVLKLSEDVETGFAAGLHFVEVGSELYPKSLLLMDKPPIILCCHGGFSSLWQNRIAVVGSREPRVETNTFLDKILHELLTQEKAVIVSGGARGVDQRSHLCSLRLGLPTVVVVPAGLLNLYPASLNSWQAEVLRLGGLFVSEYSPRQEMRKNHFEARNRIISGLGQLVLVAEARQKSGSMITAKCAIEQGKTVAVIPGHPTDSHFGGCLELMVDGAFPIRCAEDLIMLYRAESQSSPQSPH